MTKNTKPPLLFSVRDTPRFPRALWLRFKDEAARRGFGWIDALRQAVEQYIGKEPRS